MELGTFSFLSCFELTSAEKLLKPLWSFRRYHCYQYPFLFYFGSQKGSGSRSYFSNCLRLMIKQQSWNYFLLLDPALLIFKNCLRSMVSSLLKHYPIYVYCLLLNSHLSKAVVDPRLMDSGSSRNRCIIVATFTVFLVHVVFKILLWQLFLQSDQGYIRLHYSFIH